MFVVAVEVFDNLNSFFRSVYDVVDFEVLFGDVVFTVEYAFLGAKKEIAYMIMKSDDAQKAEVALTAHGVRLADQEELSGL